MITEYRLDKMHSFTKILLAEEIYYIKHSLAQRLTGEGYFVLTASSGEEAFIKFKKYTPDIILVSDTLSDMTALELIQKIRKEESFVKILNISTGQSKEDLSSYIDGKITSPVDQAELISSLKSLHPG